MRDKGTKRRQPVKLKQPPTAGEPARVSVEPASAKRKKFNSPKTVYGADARIAVPLEPGREWSDEEILRNIAFCCKICNCPSRVKEICADDDHGSFITPAQDVVWHRRCCHRAFDARVDWLPDLEIQKLVMEEKLISGALQVDEGLNTIGLKALHGLYMTNRRHQSEIHNEDELECIVDRLRTDVSYQLNEKWFQEVKAQSQKKRGLAVVLDLFGGIGTGIICLKRLGIGICKIIHVEYDHVANAVYKFHHCKDRDEIEHIFIDSFLKVEEGLQNLLETHGPFDIVLGGPPCVDYTAINARRQGANGIQGSYLLRMGQLVLAVQKYGMKRKHPCFFLAENAAILNQKEVPIEKTDLSKILGSFRISWEITLDSRDHSPLRRKRTYITNIPLTDEPPFYSNLIPAFCFDGDKRCPERKFDIPGRLLEPNMTIRAPGLMASIGRLDDERMRIYREVPNSRPLEFEYRTPSVVERERLLGLPEKYILAPVSNLFHHIMHDGLERTEMRPNDGGPSSYWEDCLAEKYHVFAGDYHRFGGEYAPFKFGTDTLPMALKLAPPLATQTVQYYDTQQYAKRLAGNAFSVPTVEYLLSPLKSLFISKVYADFDYDFAWKNARNCHADTQVSPAVRDSLLSMEVQD